MGVVGMIYEARPNVTVDSAGLCLKSGNAALLRGSASAFATNTARLAVLAEAGTVVTLLPGVEFSTRQPYPDARRLLEAGVDVAIATDCNPGTSPLTSLLLTMNMGATLFRMTPAECLAGVTAHAARALGLDDRGRIAPGLRELGRRVEDLRWILDRKSVV